MDKPLRVLIVEDSDKDVALEVRALKAAGYQVTYVVADTATEMKAALAEQAFDIVISDHDLPQFDAPGALAVLKQSGQDIPFIIVSGVIGEENAVALMKAGAHDYVMKDKLARLVPAVQRELREAETRRERRRAEEALIKAKTLLDKTFASMEDAIFIVDSNTRRIIACNQATEVIFGFGEKDLIGCSIDILHVDKLSYDLFGRKLFPALDANGVFRTEFQMRRKDGSVFSTANTVTEILDDLGHRTSLVSVVRDITDRKMTENKMKQTNIFLDSIIENIPNMIFLKDARDLRFIRLNRAGEDLLGYSRDDLLGKSDYDFFSKEHADHFTKKDREVLNGKEVVDIPEESLQTRSKGERTIHTKKVPLLDAKGEPEFLLGISEDITERKQAEEKLKDTLESLRKSFGTIIQVMVSAVETRDPYTAGHQSRVADITCAIATEMGLSQEKIDGIRMAGSIHDIGKLSIPAEILSKPGKLSAIEFSLIKEHARKGYEMLKDVESPWPLAQIVYQHHERMDGSGYPRNLKADDILIEARILAVADVVESMASHRPYRPAYGINAALEEIEKNKGILYDDAVADACLRLFREKGFQIEGA